MNIRDSVKLMQIYAACPKCGCEVIGNGKGALEADTSIGYFKRTCHCGWFVEVKEGVQEVPDRVLQALELLELLDEEPEKPHAVEAPAPEPAADEPPAPIKEQPAPPVASKKEIPRITPGSSFAEELRPASETALKEASTVKAEEPRLWNGFVHIRCDHCGKETTTCLRTPTSRFTCRECGKAMDLPDPVSARIRCECGFGGKYITNIPDWKMDIPCGACGMPNTVSYNPAKNHYEPVGMVGARKSKSPKKKKK